MSDKQQPIDGEFGADYQLYILRRMLEQLPDSVRDHCVDQVDNVRQAIKDRERMIKRMILGQLEDLRLEIKSMAFDLDATRRERDKLQRIVDDLS